MILEFESGDLLEMPSAADLQRIDGEEFSILFKSEGTYLQCAVQRDSPGEYVLEYQIETLDQHFQAIDGPITTQRVIAAFKKYLEGDESWLTDFQWEKMQLP